VLGDEGKLRQVLINLLGNAVKFTARGGVTLRARWRGGLAEFEVKDTGYGIAADELETLFEPFVQTESGRKSKEGTGLGLAISRNFVHMMGGDIRVRSAVGGGSAFSFDVELAEVAEGDERAGRRTVLALEPGQPEYRILIVDDAERNREVLVKLLTSVGFAVSEATDGREAVAVWASWRPDLVLMDMRMPTMDGRAATQEIRRLEQSAEDRAPSAEVSDDASTRHSGLGARHCVIISLTASAFEHERDEILAAGCDDFLTKPFREDLLFQKLAAHLGARFQYAADRENAGERAAAGGRSLVPGRLRALPLEWLSSLNDAVVKGDVEQANRLVDGIHDRDAALADELRDLIKAYRFDEIQDLIEQIPQ
jgi:two-component system sensor histidine kinase/response regulator